MDEDLVAGAVAFHGRRLCEALEADQPELWPKLDPGIGSSAPPEPLPQRPSSRPDADAAFSTKLLTFVSRKADILFKPLEEMDRLLSARSALEEEEETGCSGRMPPLEVWMELDVGERKRKFVQGLQVGDILFCSVKSVQENCLVLLLLCTSDSHPVWVEDLEVTGFCGGLPRQHQKEMRLEEFSPKDLVKVKFMSAMLDGSMRLLLTMSELVAPGAVSNKLGPVADDELPSHYRAALDARGYDFERVLESLAEFKNPGNLDVMGRRLLIDESLGIRHPTLMRGLHGLRYSAAQRAPAMAKAQYAKWALESVSKGVEDLKRGKSVEAMLCLNRALKIDPDNVEGLVARGVCQASANHLRRAIEDFELALRHDPSHHNAKKFLTETLMALGAALTEKGDLDGAKEIYTRVIELKPKSDDARTRLGRLGGGGDGVGGGRVFGGMRSDMSPERRDAFSPRSATTSGRRKSTNGRDDDQEDDLRIIYEKYDLSREGRGREKAPDSSRGDRSINPASARKRRHSDSSLSSNENRRRGDDDDASSAKRPSVSPDPGRRKKNDAAFAV